MDSMEGDKPGVQNGDAVTQEDVNTAIDEYFTNYENISVHETMLKDEPRNEAYREFIESNKDLFRDKVVLDVGAGTGLLSLLCARAGAKMVYAVEASGVSKLCAEIAKLNNLDDHISVIHAKVEDLQYLPSTDGEEVKVDILVSEWMGFYLLHESMLDSVIVARDKFVTNAAIFLKADGIMIPSHASISVAPISMKNYHRENVACWSKVCGFDYTPMKTSVRRCLLEEPIIDVISKEQCLATHFEIATFDLKYVDAEDTKNIRTRCSYKLTRNGLLHGFACWFDCHFKTDDSSTDVTLSTGPHSPATHWKQTIMMLPNAFMVNKNDQVECAVTFTQNAQSKRRYDVCIEMLESEDEEDNEKKDEIKNLISDKIKK